MAPRRRKFDRFMVDVELGSNLKIGRFNDGEFRCLITGVWALAAKTEPRGCLSIGGTPATSEDVAHQARCSVALAKRTIEKMVELGMLRYDEEHDWLAIHDWDEVNPAPKRDLTATARQRRRRAQGHADVTPDVTPLVTPLSRRDMRVVTPNVTPTEVKKKEETIKRSSEESETA